MRSAVLPIKKRRNPERPWVEVMIRSTPAFLTYLPIRSTGEPTAIFVSTRRLSAKSFRAALPSRLLRSLVGSRSASAPGAPYTGLRAHTADKDRMEKHDRGVELLRKTEGILQPETRSVGEIERDKNFAKLESEFFARAGLLIVARCPAQPAPDKAHFAPRSPSCSPKKRA